MVKRNEIEARVGAMKAAIAAKAAERDSAINNILEDARAGLIRPPAQGAPWSAEARYTAGDTVEGGYVALRYNRGKEPSAYLGVYWELPASTVTAWDSIADGTVIHEGDIVSYGGATWTCTAQHIKSLVYKPKAGSSKWAVQVG